MKRVLLSLVVLASVLAGSQVKASWAYVPLELRLAGATYIVVGKIDRFADDIQRGGRTFDVGAIKVKQMLKGPKGLKEVMLMWPGKARFALSTDIKFKVGQEGVWILYPDKMVKNVYWASYPTDHQPLANLPKVREKLKALNSIAWSKAVNGLQLGAIIEQYDVRKQKIVVKGRPVKALSRATAYVLLRNNGKAPTHAVNFPGDHPFTYKLTGPDGRNLPMALAQRGGGKLAKHHFLPVAPGKMRSASYGMALPLLIQPGKYTLEMNYKNQRQGGNLVKGAVWKGQMNSSVTFQVK